MTYANMCGKMPSWTKDMPFYGTVTERAFRKKNPKHGNIYKMRPRCALDFFPAKRARWQSRVLDFFQDSRIRVKSGPMRSVNLWTDPFNPACCRLIDNVCFAFYECRIYFRSNRRLNYFFTFEFFSFRFFSCFGILCFLFSRWKKWLSFSKPQRMKNILGTFSSIVGSTLDYEVWSWTMTHGLKLWIDFYHAVALSDFFGNNLNEFLGSKLVYLSSFNPLPPSQAKLHL